jgi:calcium-dependent protein kinase
LKVHLLHRIDAIWEKVDPDCISLIKRLLTYDRNKRISASEALQHPWIVKHAARERKVTDKEILLSLNNLKNFRVQTLLQAAVLSYITSQQLSQEEEARIRGIFDSFDKDKNGQLTKEELIYVLRYMHGDCKRIYREAEEILRNIDLDNNGTIEYNGTSLLTLRVLSGKSASNFDVK